MLKFVYKYMFIQTLMCMCTYINENDFYIWMSINSHTFIIGFC